MMTNTPNILIEIGEDRFEFVPTNKNEKGRM